MQVELNKRDLVRLVTSVEPNENQMNNYTRFGYYCHYEWHWYDDVLHLLSEQQLYDMYVDCRKWINEQEDYIESITNGNNKTKI